jgi:hypothetical protein
MCVIFSPLTFELETTTFHKFRNPPPPPPRMAQQPLVGQGLLILEASLSHSDKPHFVGVLWTSDQPDAETSTWQHTTLTTDRHPCLQRDSNPQAQQANGHRPTPFFFCGEGPRSRCYGRTAALRLFVQFVMKMKRKINCFFFFFPSNGAPVEWNWQGKTEVLGEKPVPVPLCPPQIPHGLTRDRTRASAVGGRRLTAWPMTRVLNPMP